MKMKLMAATAMATMMVITAPLTAMAAEKVHVTTTEPSSFFNYETIRKYEETDWFGSIFGANAPCPYSVASYIGRFDLGYGVWGSVYSYYNTQTSQEGTWIRDSKGHEQDFPGMLFSKYESETKQIRISNLMISSDISGFVIEEADVIIDRCPYDLYENATIKNKNLVWLLGGYVYIYSYEYTQEELGRTVTGVWLADEYGHHIDLIGVSYPKADEPDSREQQHMLLLDTCFVYVSPAGFEVEFFNSNKAH